MNRGICFLLVIICTGAIQGLFAQSDLQEPEFAERGYLARGELSSASGFLFSEMEDAIYRLWRVDPVNGRESAGFIPVAAYAQSAASDAPQEIPQNIRNNRFFIESVRLTNLAQEAYEYGDYDASVEYAEEAMRNARLSDEYVALQLRIKAADDAIRAARNRITWAASVGAAERYPYEYGQAQTFFRDANTARSGEDWEGAVRSANQVIDALALVTEAPPAQPAAETPALPAQYTVRPWNVSKDCFWNIAGRSWAYGDSTKWRLIYNANKAKLPQPDNPDLIHPGMILDIPSVNGELRRGMWDANKTYNPLR
jgi:hypothetical protein